MTGATDALLWGFVALVALAALALAFSRWPAWAKALLAAGVVGLYAAADGALSQVWGWPSSGALPERFVVLAVVVDEPSRTDPGALYVWVNAIDDGRPARRPRAHVLPYRKDLHGLFDEAMKKTRQGVSQIGTAEPRSGPRGFSWLRPGGEQQEIKIRDLPVPQLPEK